MCRKIISQNRFSLLHRLNVCIKTHWHVYLFDLVDMQDIVYETHFYHQSCGGKDRQDRRIYCEHSKKLRRAGLCHRRFPGARGLHPDRPGGGSDRRSGPALCLRRRCQISRLAADQGRCLRLRNPYGAV